MLCFVHPLDPEQSDDEIREIMEREQSRFIIACMKALHRMLTLGHGKIQESAESKRAVFKLKCDSDAIAGFIEWRLGNSKIYNTAPPSAGKRENSESFYVAYRDYCEENGITPIIQKNFKTELEKHGFTYDRDKFGRYYTWTDGIFERYKDIII